MGIMSKRDQLTQLTKLGTQKTYREGTLERDEVALYAVDGRVRDRGLAVLQSRSDIHGLPLDRGL